MNNDYEAFCMANAVFYDIPARGAIGDAYEYSGREAPAGWRRYTDDHWVNYAPDDKDRTTQGWKVHLAGCARNAERLIEATWSYAVPRGIAFKFLYSPRVLLARNAKYAARGGSGKLVTIYPRNDAEFETTCLDLDGELGGEPGPYILSDLRVAYGPVYVRYGGFTPRMCKDERGEDVLAIEDASGELVPDRRGPTFALPPWIALPDFLEPHLEARRATTVSEIPYDITEALHFSNGGGVYGGTDTRTGEKVVLKEARPHAGLTGDGVDAVTRLHAERDVMAQLAGIDAVPGVRDFLTIGEHSFLVMDHVEGEALKTELVRRCPLLDGTAGADALAAHAEWVLGVHQAIERAVAEIHARGIVYGDLHMFNVIVRPDGRIALIDFEIAERLDAEESSRGLGAFGFAAPRDWRGVDVDRFALAALRLSLFLPLQPLVGLERAKARDLADVIAETFPVSRVWLDEAVEVLAGEPSGASPARQRPVEPTAAGWERSRATLALGIRASATPDRGDRLFPGDILQFRLPGGGMSVAHGAAGVLYALDVTGAGCEPAHEEWLIRSALAPERGTRLGFYDGLHGVAHVLAQLGHRDEAMKVLDMCLGERWESGGHDLYGGLAGMGLNLAHMADLTGDPALDDAAARAAALVADGLGAVDDVATISGGDHPYAGLMHGGAGRALFLVRMYERTGEAVLLEHAATALRQDLRRCTRRSEGGHLHVDEEWRTLPYLATGSVGIGLVLGRHRAHRHDDDLAEAAAAIRGAALADFYAQPGLFNGRAGMILYLADDRRSDTPVDPALDDQIRRLDWHALSYEGHLAFPGDQLLRLSMDLATGSAGVLLALGSALHGEPVHLPFLGPPLTGRGPREHTTDE